MDPEICPKELFDVVIREDVNFFLECIAVTLLSRGLRNNNIFRILFPIMKTIIVIKA